MELLDDAEIRAEADALRERALATSRARTAERVAAVYREVLAS